MNRKPEPQSLLVNKYREHQVFIAEIISYLLILLFIYTAANKIWKFHNFSWVLGTLPLIGKFNLIIAYGVPGAEIAASLLLLFDKTRKYGLILSALLLTMFTAYLVFMVIYTDNLPCNCGGVLSSLSWKQHILFNLVFLALAIAALVIESNKKRDQSIR